MFAAHRAVAIHHGCERSVHFVPDGPTQALSLVHDDLPPSLRLLRSVLYLDTAANAFLRAASNSSPRGLFDARLRSRDRLHLERTRRLLQSHHESLRICSQIGTREVGRDAKSTVRTPETSLMGD
jgi:hypothetical protein